MKLTTPHLSVKEQYLALSDEGKKEYIRQRLERCSWSEKEIDILFAHFLGGGLLSEIIGPSEAAMQSNDAALIEKSIQSLQIFDTIVTNEKINNADLSESLMTNFLSDGDIK